MTTQERNADRRSAYGRLAAGPQYMLGPAGPGEYSLCWVDDAKTDLWVCWWHPDGNWVTQRKATATDQIAFGFFTSPERGATS